MGMMLDWKQIWVIFLFEFKWVITHQRQLATSTRHLAQELLMGHTMQWWFKKFCKGDYSLNDEECIGWSSKIDDLLRGSSKLIILQLHLLPKNSTSTILWLVGVWCKLESWKSSLSRCLETWPKTNKNHCFEVSSYLILCNNNKTVLDQIVMCNEKWIL